MRKSLFNKDGCMVNITSDYKNLEKSSQHIAKFLDSLPSSPSLGSDPWLSRLPYVNEAIVVPTQVRVMSEWLSAIFDDYSSLAI
jgi:presequence protease